MQALRELRRTGATRTQRRSRPGIQRRNKQEGGQHAAPNSQWHHTHNHIFQATTDPQWRRRSREHGDPTNLAANGHHQAAHYRKYLAVLFRVLCTLGSHYPSTSTPLQTPNPKTSTDLRQHSHATTNKPYRHYIAELLLPQAHTLPRPQPSLPSTTGRRAWSTPTNRRRSHHPPTAPRGSRERRSPTDHHGRPRVAEAA